MCFRTSGSDDVDIDRPQLLAEKEEAKPTQIFDALCEVCCQSVDN